MGLIGARILGAKLLIPSSVGAIIEIGGASSYTFKSYYASAIADILESVDSFLTTGILNCAFNFTFSPSWASFGHLYASIPASLGIGAGVIAF